MGAGQCALAPFLVESDQLIVQKIVLNRRPLNHVIFDNTSPLPPNKQTLRPKYKNPRYR